MSTKRLRRKISVKKRNAKKGGQYGSEKKAGFVEFNDIIKDNCTICQAPLKSSEEIKTNGIVYQLTCGHQFHSNCLKGLCERKTNEADYGLSDNEKISREPINFSCPICRGTKLKEDHDCISVNTLYPIGEVNKEYKTRKYTGMTIIDSVRDSLLNRKKGGKTKSRKTKKVRQNRKKRIR